MVLQDLERGKPQVSRARKSVRGRAPPSGSPPIRDCWVLQSRRSLARLQRSRRRLLHARPDQGVDRHAGRRRQGRPRQARHPGEPRDRSTCTIAASKSRRRRISRSWSCSRSASRKGKWGTLLNALLEFKRDYDSNAPLAAGAAATCRRSPAASTAVWDCASSPTDVRAAARLAADALARRSILDVADAGDDAERRVSAPGPRRDRARAARRLGRPRARDERRAVPARNSDAHARRVDGAGRRPVSRLPAGAVRRGTSVSRASDTTRTASRIATATITCSA